jgi:4-hydroxybenzoate polyprenyltransferase
MIKITFLVFILFVCLGFFLKFKKNHLIYLLKDLRYLRIGHYLLFGFLGVSLKPEYISFPKIDFQLSFNVIFSILSVIFGIIFSIITNNIFDEDIDKISNPNRPHVQGTIAKKDYQIYAILFLFLSLIFAVLINISIFFLVCVFIGFYFIYSVPPLRIKRIPVISKWIIGLNSVVLLNIGRTLFYPNYYLPFTPSILLILGVGLASNFIDLKDIEGDRLGKIKTVPIIMGEKNSKRLIGAFFLLIYPSSVILLFPYFPESFLISFLLPFLVFIAFFQYLLVNQKAYSEIPIFLLNNFSILFIGICLLNFTL